MILNLNSEEYISNSFQIYSNMIILIILLSIWNTNEIPCGSKNPTENDQCDMSLNATGTTGDIFPVYMLQRICGTRYSPESLTRSENPGNP